MLISYNWLQTYFDKPLLSPEKIKDTFTFHAFEIEAMEQKVIYGKSDVIFDVKVLPDRNHYALSHRGMAYELSAILDIPKIKRDTEETRNLRHDMQSISIKVEAPEICTRYISRKIEDVTVGESSPLVKERLESIGGRAINSIVDATNFVMFDMGQPLHAFDADKINGQIVVRYAKPGEKIIILNGREITLDETMLVIADEQGPLAIAGIKGGKRAEVSSETKNIMLEAATFNAGSIRKTSLKIGIRNESSKRFENAITPVFGEIGMDEVTSLITSICKDAKVGPISDIYSEEQEKTIIKIAPNYISEVLGVAITKEELKAILRRLNIGCEENSHSIFVCDIPAERLDLVIAQDLVEEVGRLYGYDKIAPAALPSLLRTKEINSYFFYAEKVKDFLIQKGFSEVSTYTLSATGDFEIEKSASDKKFVRTNLTDGIAKSLELNVHNAPLLSLSQIKIFEIGKTFKKTGEELSIALGISNTKVWKGEAANEEIKKIRDDLFDHLGIEVKVVCTVDDSGGILMLDRKEIGISNNTEGIAEFNFGVIIEALPTPSADMVFKTLSDISYKPFSTYPFALRDIAVFVPGESGRENEVLEIIHEHAGKLLVNTTLFDTFTKKPKEGIEGEIKTSYAFRLVFQAENRTLTDDEINPIMQAITDRLNSQQGWQVR